MTKHIQRTPFYLFFQWLFVLLAELQTICSAYWNRLYLLEGDKYDLERQIKLKQMEVITIGLPKEERACRVTCIDYFCSNFTLSPSPLFTWFLTPPRAWSNDILGRTAFRRRFWLTGLWTFGSSTFARLLDREMPRDTNVPNSLWDFEDSLKERNQH